MTRGSVLYPYSMAIMLFFFYYFITKSVLYES